MSSATQTQKTPVLQDKTNSTPTGSGPSATSGSDKSGSKQQSRKPVNSREKVQKALTNLSKDFQGNDERIGVLGLPSEGHLTHKKHPDEFLENVMNVAGTDYNYGMDLKPLLEQNKDPRIALALLEPVAPEDVVTIDKDGNETVRPPSYGERFKYETKYKQHHSREQTLESNMGKVYELMLGQCTPLVRQELKGREDYDVKHATTDVLWLIQELRKIYIGIDEKSNPMLTYSETILNFTNIRQYATETIDDFMKRLVTYYLAAEDVGGKYVLLPLSMYDAAADNSEDDSDGNADRILLDKIKEEFLAMMLMQRSDRTRFGAKLRKLKEDSEEGNDNYPKTLRGAYDLLLKTQTRWMEDAKRGRGYRNGGFSFYQGDENKENQCLVCGVDGRSYPGVQCHFCKEIGHYKGQCPKLHGEKKVSGALTYGYLMHNKLNHFYLKNSMFLLDTGATHSTVNNEQCVTNVTICNKENVLCTITNTGSTLEFNRLGGLSFLPLNVYVNETSVANILAFHEVNSIPGAHLYFNGREEDAMFLVFDTGRVVKFKRCLIGLYYYDAADPTSHEFECSATFVQTARSFAQVLSKEEKRRAKLARHLQEYLRWPSSTEFKRILDGALVKTEATSDDLALAEADMGPPVEIAKGKLIRKTPKSHVTDDYFVLPEKWQGLVENLYVDVMKVGGIPFLLSKSGKIKGLKAKALENEQLSTLVDCVCSDLDRYRKRGFVIGKVHGDNTFNKDELKEAIRPSLFEAYAANEHVGMVERDLRTSKERVRCTVNGKPYKKVPKVMIIDLVEGTVDLISSVGRKGGLSDDISPNSIIDGIGRLDLTKKVIGWGSYAQVWTGTKNTMEERGIDAVALRPSNNHGGFYFLNLNTGKRIHSNQWTEMPITQAVIDRVESLADNGAGIDAILEELKHEPEPEVIVESEKIVEVQEEENLESEEESAVENVNEVEIQNEEEEAVAVVNDDPMDPIVSDSESEQTESQVNEIQEDGVMSDSSSGIGTQNESSYEYESSGYEEETTKEIIDENKSMTEACDRACEELKAIMKDYDEKYKSRGRSDKDWVEDLIEEYRKTTNQAIDDVSRAYSEDTQEQVLVEDVLPGDEDVAEQVIVEDVEPGEENVEVEGSIPAESSENDGPRRSARLAGKVPGAGLEKHVQFKDNGNSAIPEKRPYGSQSTMNKVGFTNMQSSYDKAARFLMVSEAINYKPCFVSAKMERDRDTALEKPREEQDQFTRIVNSVFASMPASIGIREFGDKAIEVMLKEFNQLDKGAVPGKPVVVPQDPDVLTQEDKDKALDAVNLVELKRDGRMKGRTCANGSKQRKFLKEYESVASPTVMLEGLYGMLLIGAYEKRQHISFDVPGAFLQAPSPDDKMMLLKLRGRFVDLMCEVNPEHKKNVLYEVTKSGRQQKVLYMKVVRTLYGCIEAALQWYCLFTDTLKAEGFKLNPYDRSVANKMVNGKQLSIAWHVDDCMANHMEDDVLDELGRVMIKHFGEMKITKGNKHSFLGMEFTIHEDGRLEIDMEAQIEKAIHDFEESGDRVDDTVAGPWDGKLNWVKEDAEQLDADKSDIFHSITAKLLYLQKRARPDIETGVSFLMRRVSKSDVDDWKKLRRILGFLKKTIKEHRFIGASSLSEILSFVDASYAVHADMKSHTGGLMTMGHGIVHGKSSVQKINTKSACESELVAVAEYLPYILWFRYFMQAQGYMIENNILYQDNKSAILMERNGRNSCTGNSRHINVRYFWIKDRVENKEIRVEYMPTKMMLADYFTKPLVGSQFRLLRSFVMGWRPISELISPIESKDTIKEDVGI